MKTRHNSLTLLYVCAFIAGIITDMILQANTDLVMGWRMLVCGLVGLALSIVWPSTRRVVESN